MTTTLDDAVHPDGRTHREHNAGEAASPVITSLFRATRETP